MFITGMDYTPEHIWLLIARKLSGEASVEELHELEELLRRHPDAGYSKEILHDFWRTQPNYDSQYAENRYKELVQQMKNMGIDEGKFTQDDHYISDSEVVKRGKRNWLLALCSIGILAVIAGCIFYLAANEGNSAELAEVHAKNQVATKNGSKTSLVLPDGTKVWLNSGSQLDYDKTYGNKLREVSLTGEAYFDVVKNASKPFVIHTSKMDIKVLGTAFNVKCYPGEKTTETSLVRGSIEVTLKDRQEKIMLKPNEKLVINNDDRAVSAGSSNLKQVSKTSSKTEKPIITLSHLTFLPIDSTVIETAWVQNRLIFSSETFEDIALKMERWYNVKIEFADEDLKDETLTGNFEKETVMEAFNALQIATRFSYVIKYDKITIYKNTAPKKQ
ncbi:MAG: FecR family protein [Chitinophagaceae bacterium]|nr:FecR family protein [Chitinophagaceae bacterium]